MAGRGPNIPNVRQFIQSGIDPKTGLPLKMVSNAPCQTKEMIKRIIRKNDRQIAVNRYKWKNLPAELSSEQLEKNLYYWGNLAFWYDTTTEKFYFTKYALDGGLDFYGRYTKIHPIPLNGGGSNEKMQKAQEAMLSTYKLEVAYDVVMPEDLSKEKLFNTAVLLADYTNGLPQVDIPTKDLHEPLMDLEAETLAYLRTSLLLGSGVKGIRMGDGDADAAWASVQKANQTLKDAALSGDAYTPITSPVEIQELTDGQLVKAQDYLLSAQALDNFRLNAHGVSNGGFFEKKAYVNEAQTSMNISGDIGCVLEDGLAIRRRFCDIVNSIWGLGISVDVAENILGKDLDGDGLAYDRNQYTGGQNNE